MNKLLSALILTAFAFSAQAASHAGGAPMKKDEAKPMAASASAPKMAASGAMKDKMEKSDKMGDKMAKPAASAPKK